MTRVNCIPVRELCDKHLLSEYRELPRVFTWLEKVIEKNNRPRIPAHYVLGTGHMSFFW
jgi:deoxyribonuclease (pyrimidine dimer)